MHTFFYIPCKKIIIKKLSENKHAVLTWGLNAEAKRTKAIKMGEAKGAVFLLRLKEMTDS